MVTQPTPSTMHAEMAAQRAIRLLDEALRSKRGSGVTVDFVAPRSVYFTLKGVQVRIDIVIPQSRFER